MPAGDDRYRWGLTVSADNPEVFGLEVWNNRFDRVHADDGQYVFCLHPGWWWSFADGERPADAEHPDYDAVWEGFDEHLDYVRGHDVSPTTFRDLVAE